MKRAGYLIEGIAEPENLRLAFWKAKKGKSDREEVRVFGKYLDKNLLALREGILSGAVSVGSYRYFKVFDPKERLICAADFSERVLHHAIMNVCGPLFESTPTVQPPLFPKTFLRPPLDTGSGITYFICS
ncbi:hypothetical protein R80B4_02470 [Fibrobacteres bacterium R8-0-B4]